jgi:hypothetical protein
MTGKKTHPRRHRIEIRGGYSKITVVYDPEDGSVRKQRTVLQDRHKKIVVSYDGEEVPSSEKFWGAAYVFYVDENGRGARYEILTSSNPRMETNRPYLSGYRPNLNH